MKDLKALEKKYEELGKEIEKLKKDQDKLICGYTKEQWDHIIDGGFICEFSDWPDFRGGGRLGLLGQIRNSETALIFRINGKIAFWKYCRPAQIKGVMKPWFGGECPVDGASRVMVRYNGGGVSFSSGGCYDWCHNYESSNIVAYMEI